MSRDIRAMMIPDEGIEGMASPLIKWRRQSNGELWLTRDAKKQKLVAEEINTRSRSWAEMDHDILVGIMKRLSWTEWAFAVCYICKSWLSALLDAVFPPNNVLDLRPFDSIPKENRYFRRRYRHYMKLMLDRHPPTQYIKVIFAQTSFKEEAYVYIAQRLPSLKCCMSLAHPQIDLRYIRKCLPYWKNLEEIHCNVILVEHLSPYYKCLHTLSLNGRIGNYKASLIAGNFPCLKRLLIPSCVLSVDALSIILDSHKSLTCLNTRHCYCLESKNLLKSFPAVRAVEWNEEEIIEKAAGIEIHLQCARKYCDSCCYLY